MSKAQGTAGSVWMACVRINHHDKSYFLHQFNAFTRVDAQLVVWEDARDAARDAPEAFIVPAPWEARWRFPGGHRLLQLGRRLRASLIAQPLGAGGGEKRALMRRAQQARPDVLYAHTGFVGLRLLPLKEALGVPLVVHFHGLDINILDPVYQRVLRREIHRFDRIIVVGEWMTAPLCAMGYDRARIDVVPMGAHTKDVPMGAHTKDVPMGAHTKDVPMGAAAGGGETRFVAVARMIPYKGLDRVLAAFASAHAADPGCTLHLIGDGPMRGALEEQAAALSLGDAVVFHGQKSGDETLALMAGCDVMVHHALDDPDGPEAFGVVITEAMARGLPVIGSRCGGLPDQIVDGETGILVDQNDVDGTAAAMIKLAQSAQTRAALGQAGRARAQALFDAEVLARRAEDILLQVMAR